MNFEYREKENNSFELFNTEYNDIYFSNVGAYNEALEKFVLPSMPATKNTEKLKILDVCYGMGFNSKTFVDYCLKNNMDFFYEIDSIEIDKNILALGLFLFDDNISNFVHFAFGREILSKIKLSNNINSICKEVWFDKILRNVKANFPDNNYVVNSKFTKKFNSEVFLHNIYYQNHMFLEKFIINLKLNCIISKLEDVLPLLHSQYDIIFHDAFSIRKQPNLWEKDILNHYFRLLKPNGRLLTYSNSNVLRKRLSEIGFMVKINEIGDRKENGTIAIK